MATTDDCDCIIITVEDEALNDADIDDYVKSAVSLYEATHADRLGIGYDGIMEGKFSIVVMEGDRIVGDRFYDYQIVPFASLKGRYILNIICDPKGYGKVRVNDVQLLAQDLDALGHMFGHLIKALACELRQGR